MQYCDVQVGMKIKFWVNGFTKKVNKEVSDDNESNGIGTVIYKSKLFMTIKMPSGWKATVSAHDVHIKHAVIELTVPDGVPNLR